MMVDDPTFRLFASNLEEVIARYGREPTDTQGLIERQAVQFQTLVDLENAFRDTLIKSQWGVPVYRAFIHQICDVNGNILTSRPYFRERQDVCIGPITAAFKAKDVKALYPYHVNYLFTSFAAAAKPWGAGSNIRRLARRIRDLRQEIVETNMPLAISQARTFWEKVVSKLQDSRFTFTDFVQYAADGLMSAVDKFVPPPREELLANPEKIRVWRAVAIGRIKGNFIEAFSSTSVHFFPGERRILYRANKHLREHQNGINFEVLAASVNEDLKGSGLSTTAADLADMMGAATNPVITSSTTDEDGKQESVVDRAAATRDWEPETAYERAETLHRLQVAIQQLPAIERKVLRLRGVSPDLI